MSDIFDELFIPKEDVEKWKKEDTLFVSCKNCHELFKFKGDNFKFGD